MKWLILNVKISQKINLLKQKLSQLMDALRLSAESDEDKENLSRLINLQERIQERQDQMDEKLKQVKGLFLKPDF